MAIFATQHLSDIYLIRGRRLKPITLQSSSIFHYRYASDNFNGVVDGLGVILFSGELHFKGKNPTSDSLQLLSIIYLWC